MMGAMRVLPLQWSVGHHVSAEEPPKRWVPAQVPGAVQLDWATAEGWPPYYVGDNFKQYEWMENVFWTYRAQLPATNLAAGERLVFRCEGVDYACDVLLDGKLLAHQEGMFTPIELDVTAAAARGGELAIRVHPAPKSIPEPAIRDQANRSCKPAVSYGWDFHPRLIPLGIWQNTTLTVRPAGYLRNADLTYTLSDGMERATVRLAVEVADAVEGEIRWTILDPAGHVIATCTASADASLELIVDRPRLWWPHDHGQQPLYRSIIERLNAAGEVVERREKRFGLRRVRLVIHEGGWVKPDAFPKGRSNPPITLEINGRRIFAKGSNWVSPDIFPGTLNRDRYQQQLSLVRGSNMNIVRMWGGAPVQKEEFYDLCDELGLMVWQEFPLACNCYPDDPAYLAVLDQESRSIIRRLREHPSVILWCGGNELFNSWSKMTDQSHALRLLNANCFELDGHTPFLPTSPVMGMGHGHYTFADLRFGELEGWQIFQRADCTAYTEFGMPGPASVKVLKTFLNDQELFPPKRGTNWQTHGAFEVLMPESHLHLNVIEHYFGPPRDLETMVANGQLLQAQGYRGLFEEARRQKPRASMALNWCLNEPWPTAANLSLISWPCEPKPALAAVADACRPVLASARVPKFSWSVDELFTAELWMLNDTYEVVPAGEVRAILRMDGVETLLLAWPHGPLQPNQNLCGPRVQYTLSSARADRFELLLETSVPAYRSSYTFAFRHPAGPAAPKLSPALNL
jgi:beta-mannosidase